jgi:signal transduction histidine kinase
MMDLAIQWGPTAAVVAAGGYALLLILVGRRRGLSRAADRWFAAYLLISAVWTVSWALANVWRGLMPWVVDLGQGITVYTTALLTPTVAILTLHFLTRRGTRELTLLGVAWVVATLLIERGVLAFAQRSAVLDGLRLAGWVGFVLGSLVLTGFEYIRLHRPLHRNRVLYWIVALVLIGLGEALHYFDNLGVAEFGLLLRILGAVMMTYSILTYSLPDLKSIGRRTVLVTVVTFVRALLYLAAIVGAVFVYRAMRRSALSEQEFLWLILAGGAVGAFALAILQLPVQKLVTAAAERLLFGPGYDASRALRNYSQSISNILHIERLAAVAVETIAEALDIDRGALLLVSEQGEGGAAVSVIPGMGDLPAISVAFAPHSPVLHALKETHRPITQYDIDMLPEFRAIDPEERQWQWALDVEVYVPVHAKHTLIGILVLGAKQAGEPYSAQDLDVLNTLAGQTAVALENARLFDAQKKLNDEISQLNAELLAANSRLEKLDKAKSDFLNITSHELRTPLTQVRGYADILAELVDGSELDSGYMEKIATSIRKATERLEAIYSAMLDVSAIGTDALQLQYVPIRPALFVLQAVAQWQEAIEVRRQKLTVTGIQDLPAIYGDTDRLCQAFSNLINNAIKFTPDGGRLEISGHLVGEDESVMEIIVADQGIGIDPTDQEMIFEKFYRVERADLHSTGNIKFKGAGPGLGLPIAKGVIEGHGGRIWVESERCDEETCPGSRFHVLLPLRQGFADPDRISEQLRRTRPATGFTDRLIALTDRDETRDLAGRS